VKTAANAFLATKISFINAMSELCECAGADVVQLADAIGSDSRIGRRFLDAGLGFGGGCLPKDIRGFMARATELGAGEALRFLQEIDAINLRRRTRVVDLAREACGGSLAGMRVGVLGAAFKPNSDDVRDSPALGVAGQIGRQGAQVTVYDPRANDNARRVFPALTYTDSAVEACTDAQVILHLTDWREFRTMDPTILDPVVAQKYIVDGRNALDADVWRRAGWTYRGLGRP
jgi:UDPglucose 6-dehydrogenase